MAERHGGLFARHELTAIEDAAIDGLLADPVKRSLLMQDLPARLWQRFSTKGDGISQLQSDLDTLNRLPEVEGVAGPPLAVWLDNAARQLGLRPEAAWFREWAEQARERARAAPGDDPVAVWRAYVRTHHKTLVPFFDGGADAVLATRSVIQVEVAPHLRRLTPDAPELTGPTTLRALLERPHTGPARWVVLGEPGAGKSTLARHLAWQLCDPDAPPDGPVPVLLSLARLTDATQHPFGVAEAALRHSPGGAGLADRLHALAAQPGRVWLLLDGFDEVPEARVADAIDDLRALHGALPHVTIAVLSRPVGWARRALGSIYRRADVQPLRPDQQRALLCTWRGEAAGDAVWHAIADRVALVELGRNPLMLTLLAMLSRERPTLPVTRSGLYNAAIGLLLRRGHCQQPRGVESPTIARDLLAGLSLALTEDGAPHWPEDALVRALHTVRDADPALDRRCARTWTGGVDASLGDIARNSGIIAAHDGPGEPWRYLHRSLRERLAAEALARLGAAAVVERVKALGLTTDRGREQVDDARLGQWGETLGMACGLLDDPAAALDGLRAASAALALRVIAEVEALSADDALRFIEGIDPRDGIEWDGDTLARALRGRPGAAEALWARVSPVADLDRLAWLHSALDAVAGPVDRERFFTACGRWPRGGPPAVTVLPDAAAAEAAPVAGLTLVTVPLGAFTMGEGREAHRVRLTRPYALGVAPVTVSEYRRFDPDHHCPGGDRHPVSRVSWWRARLFAAWLGCRLPTEAEWEYGCRAGTQTRYWSGDDEADLDRVGWYDGNSGGQAHPVGDKPANAFGLYDVHGNVREWVADWHGAYPDGAGAPRVDPAGPPTGDGRVVRGGSFDNPADFARAAERNRRRPRYRLHWFGFRLARPAPSPVMDLR